MNARAVEAAKYIAAHGYDGVAALIGELPSTWIPALTRAVVEAGYAQDVWVTNGASAFVAKIEGNAPPPSDEVVDQELLDAATEVVNSCTLEDDFNSPPTLSSVERLSKIIRKRAGTKVPK